MKWLFVTTASGIFLLAAVLAVEDNEETAEIQSSLPVTDPRIDEMVERRPRCPDAENTYAWICGSLLKMSGSSSANVCTSEIAPIFSGSLSLPGQEPFFKKALGLNYALPLEPLVPCSENWPEKTHSCAQVVLFPMNTSVFGVFDQVPPDPLPEDFPKPPFESKGHTLEPDYFADFDGNPVALNYTRWIGKKPGAAPDNCSLTTRISSLDIGLELSLPCAEMGRWRDELRALVKTIKGGILSSNPSATCNIPPVGAIIRLNKYNQPALESMSQWLDVYR